MQITKKMGILGVSILALATMGQIAQAKPGGHGRGPGGPGRGPGGPRRGPGDHPHHNDGPDRDDRWDKRDRRDERWNRRDNRRYGRDSRYNWGKKYGRNRVSPYRYSRYRSNSSYRR